MEEVGRIQGAAGHNVCGGAQEMSHALGKVCGRVPESSCWSERFPGGMQEVLDGSSQAWGQQRSRRVPEGDTNQEKCTGSHGCMRSTVQVIDSVRGVA